MAREMVAKRGSVAAHAHADDKDMQLMRVHRQEMQRHDDLQGEMTQLLNALHLQRAKRDHKSEQLSEKVKALREELWQATYRHRNERHLAETKLERLVDTYCAEGYGSCAEEKQLLEQSTAYVKDVQAEICNLYNDIQQARAFRVDKGKKLAEGVSGKLEEIHDAIQAERRIREDSTKTLVELLGQMGQKIHKELEDCKKEREKTAERIVAIMENASSMVDRGRQTSAMITSEPLEGTSDAKKLAAGAFKVMKRRSSVCADAAVGRRSSFFF
mmetsp:Transcript_16484/g.47798  ORF Transcript_16484/g.47798 Transcript_16484/m.47798 type:complete len:272 (+) Transcript_16484:93-908(+)